MVEQQLVRRGISDPRVLAAMRRLPRHLFIEEPLRHRAYGDHALPIGEGQTISQPYIVALMAQALELRGSEKVLEIGTGSGYGTALLADLCGKVYSIERLPTLALRARRLVESLRQWNVVFRVGDGSYGWAEESPFHRILVAAGVPEVCPALLHQLADPGIMVLPVGGERAQSLTRVIRHEGKVHTQVLAECVFVKLLGEFGWKE